MSLMIVVKNLTPANVCYEVNTLYRKYYMFMYGL